jgi:hypothetical protein
MWGAELTCDLMDDARFGKPARSAPLAPRRPVSLRDERTYCVAQIIQAEILPARLRSVHDSRKSTASSLLDVHWRKEKESDWEDTVKRLVEFPSESGEPILVEVDDVGLAGETRRGLSTSAVVERAQTSFEDALEKARPMASSLVGKLRAIGDAAGNPPDEVQVEFGIILSAEAGAVLASASATANYKVTMTWKRSPG